MTGTVYLVGAGPGNYKLLTLRGKELLERADVVVYDRLADKRLLSFAANAETIYAGKTAARHTLRQEEINALLIAAAGAGKTVVRLKGGDPFVFGRGGEEASALAAAKIPFEIVPGVSSAIAAPAYAGIPVTDRREASSFAVITGHEDPLKTTSSVHWDKLAGAVDTLIFLMGVHHLPHLTARLLACGKSPSTPAAFVRWGTRPNQEVLTTTLGTAAADAAKAGLKPPAVFVVGSVVGLRRHLAWYDTKPLFGKRIVVTRTQAQASALTAALEEMGACCLEVPTIRLTPPADAYAALDTAIDTLPAYEWIVFTSANGVHAFFDRLTASGKDSRALGQAKIAVIGSATDAALRPYGLRADIIPKNYHAEELAAALAPHISTTTRILLPRARKARSVLPDTLRALGAAVDVCEAYCAVPAEENKARLLQLLDDGAVDVITFTSSSTVTSLMTFLSGDKSRLAGVIFACIGPITAQTCAEYGLAPRIIADTYTIPGLAAKIKQEIGE